MKREYKTPIVKMIDYSYDEQVVATSLGENFNGSGDGNTTGYCTYQSGFVSDPCVVVVNSQFPVEVCNARPWSLRG